MIGIGTDLVELDRFRTTLERTPGIKTRTFTVGEQEYADTKNDPTERYAVRWAAKEAVMKRTCGSPRWTGVVCVAALSGCAPGGGDLQRTDGGAIWATDGTAGGTALESAPESPDQPVARLVDAVPAT